MNKIIPLFFLALVSLQHVEGEPSSINSAQSEIAETESSDLNTIKNLRVLVSEYSFMTADEKMNFLSEIGKTEKEFNKTISWSLLNWKAEGNHKLSQSNSTLSLPKGYIIIHGDDAKALDAIEEEPENENLECYVYESTNTDHIISFQFFSTGYITLDDWSELDSKELLNDIIQNTENNNIERRKKGLSELKVIGWIKEPFLDKNTYTIYWIIEGADSNKEHFINSVALRLGRKGYEKITWIYDLSSYTPTGGHLDKMLHAHSFDAGYRYEDYTTGEKVASYGIASLVAASVGDGGQACVIAF